MAIKAIAAKAFFDTFWECRTFVLNLESAYSFTSPSCIIFQKCTRIFSIVHGGNIYGEIQKSGKADCRMEWGMR